MTMRDKLIDLICQSTNIGCIGCNGDSGHCKECESIADHLLANGVIVLPCKVGDVLYAKDGKECEVMDICISKSDGAAQVNFECDYVCENCAFNSWHTEFCGENSCDGEWGLALVNFSEIGKTVFLTKEEAEAALKEAQK